MNRPPDPAMDRREFVRAVTALATTGGAFGIADAAHANKGAQAGAGGAAGMPPTSSATIPSDTVIGIQMGPHTLLDKGIAPAFDLIQETAGINAVLTYSHAFHTADLRKPIHWLAPDHGRPPRGDRGRLPQVWVRHHDRYFKDTRLRIRLSNPDWEYADRDVFHGDARPGA